MAKTVGVIGLGIMGGAFASNLIAAGFEVCGFDVDGARLDALAAMGGAAKSGTSAVVHDAEVTITSLATLAAFETVIDEIAAAEPPAGRIVIDTSTLALGAKEAARARLTSVDVTLLDCPVSGTGVHAAAKKIMVFASGDEAAFKRAIPVIEGIAQGIRYVGPFGTGSKLKFIANTLVTIHVTAAAEAMVMARKAGLDLDLTREIIGASPATSPMFDLRSPLMAQGHYLPAMAKVSMLNKDIGIIRDFARKAGAPTPLLDTCAGLFEAGLAAHGDEDAAAVHAVIEERAS
jgi:3-hydroxyisobutyrate dehydrogenase-like beta-hydroxyacid dehydrogenase